VDTSKQQAKTCTDTSGNVWVAPHDLCNQFYVLETTVLAFCVEKLVKGTTIPYVRNDLTL